MAWEIQKIEALLKKKLDEKGPTGEAIYGDYTGARRALDEDVLAEIKKKVPEMTDHGVDHVIHVLDNIYRLLENVIGELSEIELYALCVSTLFHDVGNIKGRDAHEKNISDIYNFVRGEKHNRYRAEKNAITAIAGAHGGKTRDGSSDTIKPLSSSMYLHKEAIRAKELAAVLRFADELAEGPQRTSAYMLDRHQYSEDSAIYHAYADMTNVIIDKGNGRIALDYFIDVTFKDDDLYVNSIKLSKMLIFIYQRIIKLDQERKYTKHYCNWISTFTNTSATLNFLINNEPIDLNLSPIILSDLVVPGEKTKNIDDEYPDYEADKLVGKIMTLAARGE
jgi:hypothetical protein